MKRKLYAYPLVPISISTAIILLVVLVLFGCNNNPTEPDPEIETVTDIDGNTYQTVRIGDQWWMVENLKVTHYRNGDPITNVTGGLEWVQLEQLTTGAYCNYNNDENNVATYARLYNWYAIDDSRNIAPEGWHVPSDTEWQILVDYLGGVAVAGGKMKETGTTHWMSPNTDATNESGFFALPGGHRSSDFLGIQRHGGWWSSTEYDTWSAQNLYLVYDSRNVTLIRDAKWYGLSIRCIRD